MIREWLVPHHSRYTRSVTCNTMSNEVINIIEVFKNKTIRIPAFQRGYSWNEEHLLALWKDIFNLLPNYNSKFHFTGILVFEKLDELSNEWIQEGITGEYLESNETIAYSLVDGQQRLTSIIIFIYVLINSETRFTNTLNYDLETIRNLLIYKTTSTKKIYQFGYEIDTPSHYHLLKEIFEDESIDKNEPKTTYTKNLDKAKSFFKEKLTDFGDETKTRILYMILNQLKFSQLILSRESIDISMVFETLNFRGKPLSYLELLKNRILFLLSRNNNIQNRNGKREKVIETWLNIYEYLGKLSKEWINEDDFLQSFWVLNFNHQYPERSESDFKLKNCIEYFFEEIFPISNETNHIIQTNELIRFLKKINYSIRSFFYLENPKEITEKNISKENELFQKLLSQNVIDYISKTKEISKGWKPVRNILTCYLIGSYKRAEFIEAAKYLERHNFLLYYLFGKRSNRSKVYLDRFTNRLLRENCHMFFLRELENLTEKGIQDYKDITKHIHNSKENNEGFFDWIGIMYLIREYERFLQSGNFISFEKLTGYKKTKLLDPNSRRPLPQNFSFQTRRLFENSIGNIVLSKNDRTNISIDDLIIDIDSSGTKSEREFDSNKINPDKIFTRGISLFRFICDRWMINLPLDNDPEMKKILFNNANLQAKRM